MNPEPLVVICPWCDTRLTLNVPTFGQQRHYLTTHMRRVHVEFSPREQSVKVDAWLQEVATA